MAALTLRVIGPKGGTPASVEVESEATGSDLKLKVQEALDTVGSEQLLFFQNGSRNSAKVPMDLNASLAAQGIEDAATITVKNSDKEVTSENSALRQSISKNGGSSYYYAHANESELPHELRYVYGGAPTKLAEVSADAPAVISKPARVIEKYSWADEGDFVCVYIFPDNEAEAISAARNGKNGEVTVNWDVKVAELTINAEPSNFQLVLRELEHDILPDECKYSVREGKKITLKLKKKGKQTWTRLVRPRR
mmetsp:Transcript_115027/g.199543  ORF Transcript_115027/g.199543 Transcript_115027/m.199543 type:complete len:252 (-) Transcript_115027:121-876(-)